MLKERQCHNMTLSAYQNSQAIAPTQEDATLAQASSQILALYARHQSQRAIKVMLDESTGETATIPAAAYNLLVEILTQMGMGNAVKVIPIQQELTTSEAASLLNVSRPYLVGLLESGEIPYRKVGTRRRVLAQDVIDYKNRIDAARMQTLEELAAQAQELNLGY